MSEFVDLTVLSPEASYALLETYAYQRDFDPWLHKFIEPQWFAWLIALLKAEPDNEEFFPKGKWATIQRLEQLLENAVTAELQADAQQ